MSMPNCTVSLPDSLYSNTAYSTSISDVIAFIITLPLKTELSVIFAVNVGGVMSLYIVNCIKISVSLFDVSFALTLNVYGPVPELSNNADIFKLIEQLPVALLILFSSINI